MDREVLIRLGLREARQAAKSMEFIRRNLERIAAHLPKNRRVRDIYRQLIYDSAIIHACLHDELESLSRASVANLGSVTKPNSLQTGEFVLQ